MLFETFSENTEILEYGLSAPTVVAVDDSANIINMQHISGADMPLYLVLYQWPLLCGWEYEECQCLF